MLFPESDILKLKQYIANANNITLIAHFNPDGDAIGSTTGLYQYLKSKDKNVQILVPNEYPHFLDYMIKGIPHIIGTRQSEESKKALQESNLLICMDFNTPSRIGKDLEETLSKSRVTKVLIDHHLQPDTNFDLIFSVIKVSSTCELTFEIISLLEGNTSFLNQRMAESLYTGICTDTGSFSFSCENRRTYEIVADLVDSGAGVEKVHQEIFSTYSENRLRLLGFCLSERLTVLKEQGAAFIYLSKDDLKRFNYQIGDCEGVVNYCLSMEGIEFGALITERADRIRLSFRSKYNIDVNVFARQYWNGGGHRKASGGHSFDSLSEVIERLTNQIKNLK